MISRAYLCILANSIKQSDITLVTCHCQFTRLGGSGSREVVLAGILLELRFDKLVSRDTRINSEKAVVRCSQLCSDLQSCKLTMTDESLLWVHLSIFGVGNDIIDIDRI